MNDVISDLLVALHGDPYPSISPTYDDDRGKMFIIQHPLYPHSILGDDGFELLFSTVRDNDFSAISESDEVYIDDKVLDGSFTDDVSYFSQTPQSINIPIEPHNYSLKLERIEAFYKGEMIKSLLFKYIDLPSERLKLNKIILGKDIVNKEQIYEFEYNTLKLPPYNATVTDNWGYWNNKNYRNDVLYNDFFNFRSGDVYYTKAETLTKIIFPTGGYATFDYELNDYSKIATQAPDFNILESTGTAGGLRIRQIKHHTDTTEYIHSFEYKNIDGSSSGILSGIPKYVSEGSNYASFEYCSWQNLSFFYFKEDISQIYKMNSESYINTLGLTTGNHVTYSRVVESVGSALPLRKEYLYTNHDSYPDTADFAMFTNIDNVALDNKFTSRDILRGLLTNETWYNGNNKVKEVIF